MKQKQNELIVKIVIFLFAFSFGLLGKVFAQYYYFTNSGEYQQGCEEALEIRIDSQGQHPTVGLFHLVLDPTTTIYPHIDSSSEIRKFFRASTETFPLYTSSSSPLWKEGSNYTVLQADRKDEHSYYDGTSGLYATFIFTPEFSSQQYDIVFGMEYVPGSKNRQTALGINGVDIINSGEQIDHMTGTFVVLQKPCVTDTEAPTISNISFGSTKVSHLSGLSFWLNDDWGVSGTGVPYVFLSGVGEWTGNIWGISNQYGINPARFELTLSGNGDTKIIKNTTPGVHILWNRDTWEGYGLDAYFEIDPEGLFDFGIEEEIKATFKFADRAGNSGTKIIYFNTPHGPKLVSDSASPAGGNRYVKLDAPIRLKIMDDWAGVDSGTIKVTLSGMNGTDYGPYVFSGSDLNLSGERGEANELDYYIDISNHKAFPTSGVINVSVYAEDMKGNPDSIYDYSFSTRPNCSEFQCCDPVLLDLGDGNVTYYDKTGLIISGGNPELTIDAEHITGTIDCKTEDEGLSIYDSQNNLFFTDGSILTILGTGVKGVLSGDVLALSYIIEDSQVIIDKPTESERLTGGNVDIQWHLTGAENLDDWLSGYVVQISGENFNIELYVNETGIAESLPDGEYEVIVYPVDVLGNTGAATVINFEVDTIFPKCTIEVLTLQCTNSDVEIKLSGNVEDIVMFRWWNGVTGNFGDNIIMTVPENGEYVGYVYDEAGNEGVCTGVVGTGIQDQILISYITGDAEGFECEMITGFILGNTGDSCGKDDLSKFGYLWSGGFTGQEYGIFVDNVSGFDVNVVVTDFAGNSISDFVNYTWQDTGVLLLSGEQQYIKPITGNYVISSDDLINLFGAIEGACGTGNVTVTGLNCSGASYTFADSEFTIIPNDGLDRVDGYCRFEFSDDEGIKTATGILNFVIDVVVPQLTLTGNAICAKGGTPWIITGIRSENIEGFELSNIEVTNGEKGINRLSSENNIYVWSVTSPMEGIGVTTVLVSSGKVVDGAGNSNMEDRSISWEFDNIGPDDVIFTNWQNTGYSINDILYWDPVFDSGCADISGYNYIFVEGVDCGSNIIDSGFTGDTNIGVSNLSDGKQYKLCVQPVDNLGNIGNWSSGIFRADLHSLSCEISESIECNNEGVTLTLIGKVPSDWPLGTILLSWTGYDNMVSESQLTGRFNQIGTVTGYVKRSSGMRENTGICSREIKNLDNESPIIESVIDATGYECTTITGFIEMEDEGCGNTELKYIWNGGELTLNNSYSLLYSGVSYYEKSVYVTGLDAVGNSVNTGIKFIWYNSPITAHDFIGSENVGNSEKTTNWRIGSEAIDGACGSGSQYVRLGGFMNTGEKGECTRSGDNNIIYTPKLDQTGEDVCEIWVEDDDGSTGNLIVSWKGIDTLPPECTVEISPQCVSGNVQIVLSGDKNDIATYSRWDMDIGNFDGNKTTLVNTTGIYTGYVWDVLGNTGVCTGMVTNEVLDQGEISYAVNHASGYECTIITGGVQINIGNGCGNDDFSDFTYSREGGWTENESGQYLGGTDTKVVNVSITNGAGITVQTGVTYTWQNIPVTGSDFTVENVGTGITIDWFEYGHISGGICELGEINAIGNDTRCEVDGHNITFAPGDNVEGGDSCVIVVTDGDDEGIEITITWTGIDTYGPTVTLIGGVGPQCTNENMFTVTGVFSEQVAGVLQNTLTGNNIEITGFSMISTDTYEWMVEMKGGIGEVWVNTGDIRDLLGNGYEGGTGLVLGNYDISAPSPVDLIAPGIGSGFYSSTITFEWSGSIDEGCAGISGYKLEICEDEGCDVVVRSGFISGTGRTENSLLNGTGYWRVISTDANGNTGISDVRRFYIDSSDPHCSIVEQQQCTTGDILLMLTGDKDITIFSSGGVDWNGGGSYYTGYASENGDVSVIVEDIAGHTGQCDVVYVSKHDNVAPTFTFVNNSGNECEAGSLIITDVIDTGCALLPENAYKFGDGDWGNVAIYSINAQQPGNVSVTGYVRDGLGNSGSKVATYTINNVGVTGTGFSTGNIGNTVRSITLAQFIAASNASEGNCGTGDLSFSGVKTDGNKGHCVISDDTLTYTPYENKTGSDSCSITIRDNEDSTKDILVTFNGIDTLAPQCNWYSVPSGWTSGSSVTIYLTGCDDVLHNTGRIITLNSGYDFEVSDFAGNTGILHVDYTGFDREAPTFEFNDNYGKFECETGTLTISVVNDTGIGLDIKPYSFDGIIWNDGISTGVYLDKSGSVAISGYVRDVLGNKDIRHAAYYFVDSMPTAIGFRISVLNGIDVNWKELSHARDGDCGSDPMSAEVTAGGSKGVCSISGDILSYRPNNNSVTGEDLCELSIYDDEGNSITGIKVNVVDINNYPYVNLVRPDDGEIISSGNLSLGWSLSGNTDTGLILQYVYRIWSTPSVNVEYRTTGLNAFIDLDDFRDGQYFWDVYAEFIDGTTGGLSSVYSFNVTRGTTSGGGGGRGGGGRLVKDKCPNGDKSDSYYDGTCENEIRTHGSASIDICGVNDSDFSTEQKFAYLYSYEYGITTICPIQKANLNGYLIRSHFAKMISEFAVNVLGIKPERGKEGCNQFDDIDKLTDELREFAITSCELGLMGLDADGVTPSKSFNPGNYVTRAQFGTVLSRLLFGDMYNVKEKLNKGFWYTKHLAALKEYGIMTQIDGDWPTYLERRGFVMIMLERADNYGIFAGKVPAKNGVYALFDL